MTVLVDYVMVISYYPCLVMWFERDIKSLWTVCFCCKPEPGEEAKTHPIEEFFKTKFAPFVHKLRFPLILTILVWSIVCAAKASELEPSSEGLAFFPSDDRSAILRGAHVWPVISVSEAVSTMHHTWRSVAWHGMIWYGIVWYGRSLWCIAGHRRVQPGFG